MTSPERQVFHLAVFDPSGELVGHSPFDGSQLSTKWSEFCERLLAAHGEQFAVNLTGPLAHIALRFTSASGAAIGTFSADGRIGNSLLLLSGREPAPDMEVRAMFIESVSATVAKVRPACDLPPFHDLFKLEERPLACVVVWGDPRVSDGDQELIKELSWHLAGAFFNRRG